jgi:damage-control phosphatase, subfamily III
MTAPSGYPGPLRTDESNAFAQRTMAERIPKILGDTHAANSDLPEVLRQRIEALRQNIQRGDPIPPLQLPAPDYDEWQAIYAAHRGESWHDTQWFFAEKYSYRLLIEAVRWWELGRDPFAPVKAEEYRRDECWRLLEMGTTLSGSLEERLSEVLGLALWGNRIDLSYAVSTQQGTSPANSDDLLVDDRERVVEHLMARRDAVHIITDNAGTELAMDCLLADFLLENLAGQVIMHVKLHPTFVSDATAGDVLQLFGMMQEPERAANVQVLGERLCAALDAGRLRLAPDAYWNSSHFLWELPPRLRQAFQGGALAVFKGDVNYRRVVGDAIWPPGISFEQVVGAFPAPALALRTMKSDPLVGLPTEQIQALDEADPDWRLTGRCGIIQFSAM